MASGTNLTSFEPLLKELYTDDMIENEVYKDNPFLALVPKVEDAEGKYIPKPVIYGNPQGRSRTFSQAQSRGEVTGVEPASFFVTRVKDYSLATVDNETILASKSDKGAFLKAATTAMDGAIQSATRSLAISMYRPSSGYYARVDAEPNTASGSFTLTLSNAAEITNFETEMVLNIWSAASGGTQRTSDGSEDDFVVEGIDRDAGTLTLTGTYSGSGTIAAGDYIFVKGDRGLSLSGLMDWIPTTAPTATPFFNVDRSVDVTRLAGIRQDGRGKPIEEALLDLVTRVNREGGKPDYILMNYEEYNDLIKSLGSKVQYIDLKVNAVVGFRGVELQGPKGPVKCLADQNCPAGYAWALQMDTWELLSLGKAVRIIDTDGMKWLRQNSSDGVEIRIGSYSQLCCRAPGYNGVTQLA